jgi:osmotically-inducible protein OsmY
MMVQVQSGAFVADLHRDEASPLARSHPIQELAQAKLRRSPYYDVRNAACNFHEGVLTLRGRVSSYYLKQMAQTLVRRLDGVGEIDNQLEVVSRSL